MPSIVPAIKDTITMPVSSSVDTEKFLPPGKLPRSTEKDTDVPTGTGLPALSNKVAAIFEVPNPSPGMLVGSAESVIEAVAPSGPATGPVFEDLSLAKEL